MQRELLQKTQKLNFTMCAKAKKASGLYANTGKLNAPVAVAQIVKSYNTNGEVVVKLTNDLLEDLNVKEPVFIFFDELPVPFFIEKFSTKGNSGAIVKFSSVNDTPHSEELVKKTVFVEASSVSEDALEELAQENMGAFLAGFSLTDEQERVIGQITDYHDYPNNPCIEVQLSQGVVSALDDSVSDNHTVLLPFQEQFIMAFDAQERMIRMSLPAGLIIFR